MSDQGARCFGAMAARRRKTIYGGGGTLNAVMSVESGGIRFNDLGIGRFLKLVTWIDRDEIEAIYQLIRSGLRSRMVPTRRRFNIRILSKPGGSFDGRDDYLFSSDHPPVDELLNQLEGSQFPVDREPRIQNGRPGGDKRRDDE